MTTNKQNRKKTRKQNKHQNTLQLKLWEMKMNYHNSRRCCDHSLVHLSRVTDSKVLRDQDGPPESTGMCKTIRNGGDWHLPCLERIATQLHQIDAVKEYRSSFAQFSNILRGERNEDF